MEPRDPAMQFTLDWAAAQGAVAGYIHGLITDRQAADELVQEVAVAAFRGYDKRKLSGSFTGWALGIARNLVKMRWRTLSRSKTVFTDPGLLDALAYLNEELDEDLEREQLALQRCLRSVQGRAWELLRLHYWEGLSPTQISEQLSLAAGHVRVQLHRIRGVLRACVDGHLPGNRP